LNKLRHLVYAFDGNKKKQSAGRKKDESSSFESSPDFMFQFLTKAQVEVMMVHIKGRKEEAWTNKN
jgi:hypothetical protein